MDTRTKVTRRRRKRRRKIDVKKLWISKKSVVDFKKKTMIF